MSERPRVGEIVIGAADAPEVTRWQCRGCHALVGVTAGAVQAFDTFNTQLIAMGEPHLDNRQIVFCDECRARGHAMRAEGRTKQREKMTLAIRQLKASRQPEQERELIKQLETLGHPDITGLVAAIRERREGKTTIKRRGDDR